MAAINKEAIKIFAAGSLFHLTTRTAQPLKGYNN